MTELSRRPIPPYVPPRTFLGYLDSLRAFGPQLPHVIDRDSMRSYSGSMQSWLLNALRYLHMIDEGGVPRPRLGQIVHADEEARKPLLKQMLAAEYPFLRDIDLKLATLRQIEKAFEQVGAQGDSIRKCVGFYLGLAKAADLPLSPFLDKKKRRSGPRAPSQKRPQPSGKMTLPSPAPLESAGKSKAQFLLEILDPSSMNPQEQDAVWTLLKYLKGRE